MMLALTVVVPVEAGASPVAFEQELKRLITVAAIIVTDKTDIKVKNLVFLLILTISPNSNCCLIVYLHINFYAVQLGLEYE